MKGDDEWIRQVTAAAGIAPDVESVETRIQLIAKLRVALPPTLSDLHHLLEFLATSWEDSTCLDVSQCMLNKAILDVASKYLDGCNSTCQEKFLILGARANEWCGKHLRMTVMSNDDSQEEEHYNLFFQLLLECLQFSVGCSSLVSNSPTLEDDALMISLDKFMCELLSLVKDLATEFKKIQSLTSELLKEAEMVLESAVKLNKVYSQEVNWDHISEVPQDNGICMDNRGTSNRDYVGNLIKHTIEKLSELGVIAANSGGSLVTILNLSWKGVVSLLQLCGGALSEKVNIRELILNLISLATDSLRCAAETWCSICDQTVSAIEAKRVFLPIKFYLVNAVRISSQYPHQAFAAYQEVTRCILLFTTLRCTFSSKGNLKNVCEALEELLKPTYLHLLKSLLNSDQLCDSQKLQILDWLFSFDSHELWDRSNHISAFQSSSLDELFSVNCEAMPTAQIFLHGRVVLFADMLKISYDVNKFILIEIARKLQWVLDVFMDYDVYAFALVLHIPTSYGESKPLELTCEPFLFCFLNAVKIFMILASGTQVWHVIEWFLLDNIIHPHPLCWEIIMEFWCFLVRHMENSTVNMVVDKLTSLYKFIALLESPFSTHSGFRKMARSICLLLASCNPCTVDRFYMSIMTGERSDLSAVMCVGLLMEGFQFNLLSDKVRAGATERIFEDYIHFVDDYIQNPINSCSSLVSGIPVAVLCSALQSMQIDVSGLDNKTIRFLLAAIQTYNDSKDSAVKSYCCRLVCEALEITSIAKHLFDNAPMEDVINELQKIFAPDHSSTESELQKCKPALASFMSSLAHMEMVEGDGSIKTCAVCLLFQMFLRERHWALIHLAISAFGYFAAHTSCTELWRFLPPDAALSFDVESGKNANGERFMSELKVFLDKEMALCQVAASSPEELDHAVKDGVVLRELYQKKKKKNSDLNVDSVECERPENNGGNYSNKRQKLPNGFSRGIELLQNGLKIIADSLPECEENEEDVDKILTHFCRLEDAVKQLSGLADSG